MITNSECGRWSVTKRGQGLVRSAVTVVLVIASVTLDAPGLECMAAPEAAATITLPIAQVVEKRVSKSLTALQLPDLDNLATVAGRTVSAIASGDPEALHRVARERGAVIAATRLDSMKAAIRNRPPDAVPPEIDSYSDDQMIAEANRFCRPLEVVIDDSVAVRELGLQASFDAMSALMKQPASGTELRRRFAGEPGMVINFLHVPDEVERGTAAPLTDAVIVEFEGASSRGRHLIVVMFSHNKTTGWLPAGMLTCGAPMALIR